MFTTQVTTPDFAEAIERLAVPVERKIGIVLDVVGAETVAYLRSLTGEMRPPARPGEGARQAHPGHWADITGALANAYGYRVEETTDGARLVLFNTMEYALYLEDRYGYFVLSGVTDPGGPVEDALRHVLAVIAPEWTVYNIGWSAA